MLLEELLSILNQRLTERHGSLIVALNFCLCIYRLILMSQYIKKDVFTQPKIYGGDPRRLGGSVSVLRLLVVLV